MKGVKFAGQKDPDGKHDREGQQERRNVLFGSRTGWGRFPFGGLKSLGVSICLRIRIQKMEPFSRGSPESPAIPRFKHLRRMPAPSIYQNAWRRIYAWDTCRPEQRRMASKTCILT